MLAATPKQDTARRQHTVSDKYEPANAADWDPANLVEPKPRRTILRGASLQPHKDTDQLRSTLQHTQREERLLLVEDLDHLDTARDRQPSKH